MLTHIELQRFCKMMLQSQRIKMTWYEVLREPCCLKVCNASGASGDVMSVAFCGIKVCSSYLQEACFFKNIPIHLWF